MFKTFYLKSIAIFLAAAFAATVLLSLVCPFPQMQTAQNMPSGAAFCQNNSGSALSDMGGCISYHFNLLSRFSSVFPEVFTTSLVALFLLVASVAALWRKIIGSQMRALEVGLRYYRWSSWIILKSKYEKKFRSWLLQTRNSTVAFVV